MGLKENSVFFLFEISEFEWVYFVSFQIGAVVDHKDGNNLTALHHACMDAKYECVQVLLRSGADINIKDKVRSICVLSFEVKVTCYLYGNLTSWSKFSL